VVHDSLQTHAPVFGLKYVFGLLLQYYHTLTNTLIPLGIKNRRYLSFPHKTEKATESMNM